MHKKSLGGSGLSISRLNPEDVDDVNDVGDDDDDDECDVEPEVRSRASETEAESKTVMTPSNEDERENRFGVDEMIHATQRASYQHRRGLDGGSDETDLAVENEKDEENDAYHASTSKKDDESSSVSTPSRFKPNKKDTKTDSIATLRAKAQEHCHKLWTPLTQEQRHHLNGQYHQRQLHAKKQAQLEQEERERRLQMILSGDSYSPTSPDACEENTSGKKMTTTTTTMSEDIDDDDDVGEDENDAESSPRRKRKHPTTPHSSNVVSPSQMASFHEYPHHQHTHHPHHNHHQNMSRPDGIHPPSVTASQPHSRRERPSPDTFSPYHPESLISNNNEIASKPALNAPFSASSLTAMSASIPRTIDGFAAAAAAAASVTTSTTPLETKFQQHRFSAAAAAAAVAAGVSSSSRYVNSLPHYANPFRFQPPPPPAPPPHHHFPPHSLISPHHTTSLSPISSHHPHQSHHHPQGTHDSTRPPPPSLPPLPPSGAPHSHPYFPFSITAAPFYSAPMVNPGVHMAGSVKNAEETASLTPVLRHEGGVTTSGVEVGDKCVDESKRLFNDDFGFEDELVDPI